MKVIFVFVDGIGFGKEDRSNPFYNCNLSFFNEVTGGKGFTNSFNEIKSDKLVHLKIDATLGVSGLPQSGTGQTALFTGVNAANIVGRHFGPYPHSKLKPYLSEHSLFHKSISNGFSPHFINAYPDIFFERAENKQRWTCTTLMTKKAGLELNRVSDVQQEKAITAEITQNVWRNKLKLNVPEVTPESAASRLVNATREYDLILYEYYLTDKAGHSKNFEVAKTALFKLDRFLYYIFKNKPDDTVLVLSSDHGNLENIEIKTHTFNSVPWIVSGPGARITNDVKSIMDAKNAILKLLGNNTSI